MHSFEDYLLQVLNRPRKAFNYILIFLNTFGNLANHFWVRSKPYGGPIKFAAFVKPSVRTYLLQSPRTDLHEIGYWEF
jgi:hypothetical protein